MKRVAATLAVALVAACAHAPAQPTGAALEQGVASYYGAALQGNRTASGERFDPRAFTAALRTIAFGTCLRVKNLENGRSVDVRVNDRGPFVAGRIVDLSEAAARALDFIQRGIARVKLFLCS